MPVERPTLAQVASRAQTDLEVAIPNADSRLRFSILDGVGRALAGVANGLYGYIDSQVKDFYVATASSAGLDRKGSEYGLPRKPASTASGTATISGSVGTVVPVGFRFQRQGAGLYEVTAEITLSGPTGTVALQAVEAGLAGNALAGVTLAAVNPLAGLNATATIITMTGGADVETDREYRVRLDDRIQNPPGIGLLGDYRRMVASLPGITRVWVRDQSEYGGNSVSIRFAMDNTYANGIPQAGDVATVLAYVSDPVRKVVGSEPMVQAPVALPVDFQIALKPNTADVRKAVTTALSDLLRREAEPGQVLPLSASREAISTAPGEQDHTLISPTASITPGPGELPVLGTVTFTTLP